MTYLNPGLHSSFWPINHCPRHSAFIHSHKLFR